MVGKLGNPRNIREAGEIGRASLVAAADENARALLPALRATKPAAPKAWLRSPLHSTSARSPQRAALNGMSRAGKRIGSGLRRLLTPTEKSFVSTDADLPDLPTVARHFLR